MSLSISDEAAPAVRLTWDSTIGCTYDVYESTTPYVFPGTPIAISTEVGEFDFGITPGD